jgi:hypothetical protein
LIVSSRWLREPTTATTPLAALEGALAGRVAGVHWPANTRWRWQVFGGEPPGDLLEPPLVPLPHAGSALDFPWLRGELARQLRETVGQLSALAQEDRTRQGQLFSRIATHWIALGEQLGHSRTSPLASFAAYLQFHKHPPSRLHYKAYLRETLQGKLSPHLVERLDRSLEPRQALEALPRWFAESGQTQLARQMAPDYFAKCWDELEPARPAQAAAERKKQLELRQRLLELKLTQVPAEWPDATRLSVVAESTPASPKLEFLRLVKPSATPHPP